MSGEYAAQLGLCAFAMFLFPPGFSTWSGIPGDGSGESTVDDRPVHDVIVAVDGLRSGDGRVLALLFSSSDGFPDQSQVAHAKARATDLSEGYARLVFPGVPPGTYAVAVVHDENSNGKLDTNVLGIPKEGVGASNRAPRRVGPPRWSDAKFNVSDDTVTVVAMHYF